MKVKQATNIGAKTWTTCVDIPNNIRLINKYIVLNIKIQKKTVESQRSRVIKHHLKSRKGNFLDDQASYGNNNSRRWHLSSVNNFRDTLLLGEWIISRWQKNEIPQYYCAAARNWTVNGSSRSVSYWHQLLWLPNISPVTGHLHEIKLIHIMMVAGQRSRLAPIAWH